MENTKTDQPNCMYMILGEYSPTDMKILERSIENLERKALLLFEGDEAWEGVFEKEPLAAFQLYRDEDGGLYTEIRPVGNIELILEKEDYSPRLLTGSGKGIRFKAGHYEYNFCFEPLQQ